MSDYLGACSLPAHDPDPEESAHSILPGRWVKADCPERDAVFAAAAADTDPQRKLIVWSGLTDTEGTYGKPQMFTCWGTKDGVTPLLADVKYFAAPGAEDQSAPKPCQHRIYVLDAVPETPATA